MKRFISMLLTMCLVAGCIAFIPGAKASAASKQAYRVSFDAPFCYDGGRDSFRRSAEVDTKGKVDMSVKAVEIGAGLPFYISIYDYTNEAYLVAYKTKITSTGSVPITFAKIDDPQNPGTICGCASKVGKGELTIEYNGTKAKIAFNFIKATGDDTEIIRYKDAEKLKKLTLSACVPAQKALEITKVTEKVVLEDGVITRNSKVTIKNNSEKTITLIDEYNSEITYKIKAGKTKNITGKDLLYLDDIDFNPIKDEDDDDDYTPDEHKDIIAHIDELRETGSFTKNTSDFGGGYYYKCGDSYQKIFIDASRKKIIVY